MGYYRLLGCTTTDINISGSFETSSGPPWKGGQKNFVVKNRDLVEGSLLLASYCSDLTEDNNISAVRHGVAMKRPYVRCVVTAANIMSSEMASGKSVRIIEIFKSRRLEIARNNTRSVADGNEKAQEKKGGYGQQLMNCNLVLSWLSFLETFGEPHRLQKVSNYSVITFVLLHYLYHKISLAKECTVSFFFR